MPMTSIAASAASRDPRHAADTALGVALDQRIKRYACNTGDDFQETEAFAVPFFPQIGGERFGSISGQRVGEGGLMVAPHQCRQDWSVRV